MFREEQFYWCSSLISLFKFFFQNSSAYCIVLLKIVPLPILGIHTISPYLLTAFGDWIVHKDGISLRICSAYDGYQDSCTRYGSSGFWLILYMGKLWWADICARLEAKNVKRKEVVSSRNPLPAWLIIICWHSCSELSDSLIVPLSPRELIFLVGFDERVSTLY